MDLCFVLVGQAKTVSENQISTHFGDAHDAAQHTVLCADEIVGHDAVAFGVGALGACDAAGGPEVGDHPHVGGTGLPVVGVGVVVGDFLMALLWNNATTCKVFHGACGVDELWLVCDGAERDEITVFWFVFSPIRCASLQCCAVEIFACTHGEPSVFC